MQLLERWSRRDSTAFLKRSTLSTKNTVKKRKRIRVNSYEMTKVARLYHSLLGTSKLLIHAWPKAPSARSSDCPDCTNVLYLKPLLNRWDMVARRRAVAMKVMSEALPMAISMALRGWHSGSVEALPARYSSYPTHDPARSQCREPS